MPRVKCKLMHYAISTDVYKREGVVPASISGKHNQHYLHGILLSRK